MINEIDPYLDWAQLPGVGGEFASSTPAAKAPPKGEQDNQKVQQALATKILVGIEIHDPATFKNPAYLELFGVYGNSMKCQIALLEVGKLGDLKAEPGVLSVTVAVNVVRSDQGGGRNDGGNLEGRVHRGKKDDTESKLVLKESKKVIAIIDHGCPFANDQFRVSVDPPAVGAAPKSRVKLLWDQDPARYGGNVSYWGPKPNDFLYGAELQNIEKVSPATGMFKHPMIDDLMEAHYDKNGGFDEAGCYDEIDYLVPRRAWSHGAHVMDLAAGWPNPMKLNDTQRDAAADADIIFVQLPRRTIADSSGGAMAVYVLDALQYIVERTHPDADVVVNLSFGTFAGPHDGTSFLERAIDEICALRPRLKVVLPAGNSRNEDCHAQLSLTPNVPQSLPLEVMADDPRPTFVELWWSGADDLKVSLQPPGGEFRSPVAAGETFLFPKGQSSFEYTVIHRAGLRAAGGALSNSMALIAIATTAHINPDSEVARYGVWTIKVESGTKDVVVDAWIERGDVVLFEGWQATQARFVVDPTENPTDDYANDQPVRKSGTLNAYGTGTKTELVGAKYAEEGSGAPAYASTGPGRNGLRNGAPKSVEITDDSEVLLGVLACSGMGSGVARLSGTSMAAPQRARELLNLTAP